MRLAGHALAEARSLRMHRVVAERVRENPSCMEAARAQLNRWKGEGTLADEYIDAWRALLDGPLPELLAKLVEDSETARALRQTTPFAGTLSPRERWALLKERPIP